MHARRTILALAVRGIVLFFMILGTVACATTLAQSINQMEFWEFMSGVWAGANNVAMRNWRDDNGALVLGMTIGWSILIGMLLTAGLSHIRRQWTLWAGFAGLMLMGFSTPIIIEEMDRILSMAPQSPIWSGQFRWSVRETNTVIILSCMLACATLGIPIGLRLRKALAKAPTRRFRKLLAQARRRRLPS